MAKYFSTFADVQKEFNGIAKRDGDAWKSFLEFSESHTKHIDDDQKLKEYFKGEEKLYRQQNKDSVLSNPYTSAKSAYLRARRLDVDVKDVDGSWKSKDRVRQECNEKEAKPADVMSVIQKHIGYITSKFDDLTPTQKVAVATLVGTLNKDKLTPFMESIRKAA